MAIMIERHTGIQRQTEEQFGLECPYCSVYARMSPQSIPDFDDLVISRPKHVGLVYQCDACSAPVFLRFAIKQFNPDSVELYRNFIELERPKERFQFSYLPKDTEVLFRETLACYSNNNFSAFASMCRRAAASSFGHLGDSGKLRAFDEIIATQHIAEIGDDSFEPIKRVLFDAGEEEKLPILNRAQAGILLEVLKDMFYECFVRHGKLTRAIKVRRFFVTERNGDVKSSV